MSPNRYATALFAFLLVVGVGLAASTFQTATFDTDGQVEPEPRSGNDESSTSPLSVVLAFLLLAVYFGSAGLAVGYFFGDTTPGRAAAFGVGLAALATVFLLAVDVQTAVTEGLGAGDPVDLSPVFESIRGGTTESGATGADDPSGGSGTPALPPVIVLAGLAGVVLVSLLGVVRFAGGSAEPSEPEPEEADDDPTAAVGAVAGRAADRLDGADLSNAVYRAWHEMATAVDVCDPATTTPAEFAEAAVAAGVDRADARELTALFRAVRYGAAPATPEREERAAATLRRIEAAYAEEGDG